MESVSTCVAEAVKGVMQTFWPKIRNEVDVSDIVSDICHHLSSGDIDTINTKRDKEGKMKAADELVVCIIRRKHCILSFIDSLQNHGYTQLAEELLNALPTKASDELARRKNKTSKPTATVSPNQQADTVVMKNPAAAVTVPAAAANDTTTLRVPPTSLNNHLHPREDVPPSGVQQDLIGNVEKAVWKKLTRSLNEGYDFEEGEQKWRRLGELTKITRNDERIFEKDINPSGRLLDCLNDDHKISVQKLIDIFHRDEGVFGRELAVLQEAGYDTASKAKRKPGVVPIAPSNPDLSVPGVNGQQPQGDIIGMVNVAVPNAENVTTAAVQPVTEGPSSVRVSESLNSSLGGSLYISDQHSTSPQEIHTTVSHQNDHAVSHEASGSHPSLVSARSASRSSDDLQTDVGHDMGGAGNGTLGQNQQYDQDGTGGNNLAHLNHPDVREGTEGDSVVTRVAENASGGNVASPRTQETVFEGAEQPSSVIDMREARYQSAQGVKSAGQHNLVMRQDEAEQHGEAQDDVDNLLAQKNPDIERACLQRDRQYAEARSQNAQCVKSAGLHNLVTVMRQDEAEQHGEAQDDVDNLLAQKNPDNERACLQRDRQFAEGID